ncbi:hypothetical protein L1887_59347 [Cichorium endivia]|nr:hypothetical protein L1887_59347 [Cichorium endivia]
MHRPQCAQGAGYKLSTPLAKVGPRTDRGMMRWCCRRRYRQCCCRQVTRLCSGMQRDGWQLREAWGICSGGTGTLACVRLFGWCLWAQPSQVGRAAELGRHRSFLRTLRVSRVPSFVLYRLRLGSPALHSGTDWEWMLASTVCLHSAKMTDGTSLAMRTLNMSSM